MFENYCLRKLSSLAGGWLLKVTVTNTVTVAFKLSKATAQGRVAPAFGCPYIRCSCCSASAKSVGSSGHLSLKFKNSLSKA